jgi:hypothetical protein
MEEESWEGARFMLTLINDFMRKTDIYTMKKKSDVKEILKEFRIMMQNQTGKRMKVLHTDNGTEYVTRD